MILLDTVVLSEPRLAKPNAGVVAQIRGAAPDAIFLSVLSIGEIEAAIEKQRSQTPEFAEELSQWLIRTEHQFAQAILPVTPTIAKLWGRLCVKTSNQGIDNLIVVTRNVKHFEPTGVWVINPFGERSAL